MKVTEVHKGQEDQVNNSALAILRRMHDATEGHAARGGVKPWLLTRVLMFFGVEGASPSIPVPFGGF